MRHSRSIVPFLVVLVAAACETPVEPRTAVIEASLVAAHQQGAVASATGSGHYTSGGALRTLSFNAVKRADGTTSGNYHVTIHAIQRFFDVNVTCLSVRKRHRVDRRDHREDEPSRHPGGHRLLLLGGGRR